MHTPLYRYYGAKRKIEIRHTELHFLRESEQASFLFFSSLCFSFVRKYSTSTLWVVKMSNNVQVHSLPRKVVAYPTQQATNWQNKYKWHIYDVIVDLSRSAYVLRSSMDVYEDLCILLCILFNCRCRWISETKILICTLLNVQPPASNLSLHIKMIQVVLVHL